MSTNHNRIKVADLETNEPNKILKTNVKGELEFSDANNLQIETYNKLDCTEENKALDARQGKVLKDMIDNIPKSGVASVTGSGVNNTDPKNPVIQEVSATQAGVINNSELQELGGVDKTINRIRIGRGSGNISTNTTLGAYSLLYNTTGNNNTAFGYVSLNQNTTGAYNIGVGTFSLQNNTTGTFNIAIGNNSLSSNTLGSGNTALGNLSLDSNTTGNSNTAVGNNVLRNNTTGNVNTVLGTDSLYSNTTGSANTVVGYSSLFQNTTGKNNVAIGRESGQGIRTGSNNTIISYSNNLNPDDSNLVILSDGENNVALRKEADNRLLAPTLTNSLINSGGAKSLITKEYLDTYSTISKEYIPNIDLKEGLTNVQSINAYYSVTGKIVTVNFSFDWLIPPI